MQNERGLTIIELLVAMVVFSIVLGGALSVFRSQSRGFREGSDRMGVLQNVRFAANVLEIDLRTVGSGVPDNQPFVVYAGEDVIAFNANYVTNVANDPFAVYYDPDAPSGSVSAMLPSGSITIPNTAVTYPDSAYGTSQAETIMFFFEADTSTIRGDDYILWRQVNGDPPEVVSRNLLRTGSQAFFEYYQQVTQVGGATTIQPVSNDSLPYRHSVPFHGAPADTAAAARVDSLRGVRINVTATNGASGAEEKLRTLSRLIRLPNAGIANRKTCGDEPLPVGALNAVAGVDMNGDPIVTLTWNQAVDEGGGEKDVVRYVLWRREVAEPDWGDPYLSIPSGNPSYFYVDAAVQPGTSYMYQLAAQDCTPSLSAESVAGPVTP